MPNTQLKDDVEHWEDIRVANMAGVFEPVPSGDTFSVAVDDATKGFAEIGPNPKTGNPARGVRRATGAADGVSFTVTVSDSSGLTPWVETFDVVADATPAEIVGDPNSVTDVPLPAGV